MSLRVAYAGTPRFAVPALQALAASGHVVGVLTQPDRAAGRGRALAASPVKQAAEALGLPVQQPASLAPPGVAGELARWRPDVLVVVAYGLLLPPAILDLPRLGCVNIHASLLPRWRGAAPVQRAILAGDTTTGVTVMQMDAGLDTGPMLLQEAVPIPEHASAGELLEELAAVGARLLPEALHGLEARTLEAVPQPAAGATLAPKLAKAEGLVDWRCDALQIERQVRAFNPWPVAHTLWAAEPLRILRAAVTEPQGGAAAAPGTVLRVHGEAIEVACGRGVLALRELQRAGRRVTTAAEFARGAALEGRRLG